eukprot:NODE_7628_length_754_cov_50.386688_g7379_i0.p1 GENE.NODE_7628_length_754_cov_50.386688_g7379_i0~~NODE_7628_length_754_cov_50.386688_g7379_i0.p1  ORF type:complete len:168 (-),score=31.41 NODE_7628_length_754_cov_50.386688_g7379_i0:226-729(-)
MYSALWYQRRVHGYAKLRAKLGKRPESAMDDSTAFLKERLETPVEDPTRSEVTETPPSPTLADELANEALNTSFFSDPSPKSDADTGDWGNHDRLLEEEVRALEAHLASYKKEYMFELSPSSSDSVLEETPPSSTAELSSQLDQHDRIDQLPMPIPGDRHVNCRVGS